MKGTRFSQHNPFRNIAGISQVLGRSKTMRLQKDVPAFNGVDFGSNLKGKDVGLFFYAGHGVQVSGNNYLIPVDANLIQHRRQNLGQPLRLKQPPAVCGALPKRWMI